MATVMWMIGATIAVAALWPLVRTYRRYRGTRVVTCPESGEPAAVEVDARLAAMSQMSTGAPVLRLGTCSRWPARHECGQECLAQIEAAPEGCLARSLLGDWYRGKRCVYCGYPFDEIRWADPKPALRKPDGTTVEWGDIRGEELSRVLASHAPVCWNCNVAETLRAQHPELIVDDPRPPLPRG